MKKLALVLLMLLFSGHVSAKVVSLKAIPFNQKFLNHNSVSKISNSDIYTKTGIALAEDGKLEEAVKHFNLAIMLNAKNDSAYYNMAICYMKMDKTDIAITHFEKCYDITPNYNALIRLGALYAGKTMYAQSIQYLELAKTFNEKDIALLNNLGLIYGILGDYEKAVDNFKKVLEIDSDNKNAYYNLGVTYKQIGYKELSIENFNKAIEDD